MQEIKHIEYSYNSTTITEAMDSLKKKKEIFHSFVDLPTHGKFLIFYKEMDSTEPTEEDIRKFAAPAYEEQEQPPAGIIELIRKYKVVVIAVAVLLAYYFFIGKK